MQIQLQNEEFIVVNRFYPHSIYNFLRIADLNPSLKRILDCGAGGSDPKIAIFNEYGYEMHGIDIDDDQIKDALEFAKKQGIKLNIIKGDMCAIPFEEDYFGFVFSYLSMVHLTKGDIGIAIDEIHRVLQKGGLCYINFLSKEDKWYEEDKISSGEIKTKYDDVEEIHSYFGDHEPDKYFDNFEIIYKAKIKILKGKYHNTGRTCILDYIAKKRDK